jgi:hypothetical protein
MSMNHHSAEEPRRPSLLASPASLVLLGLVAAGGFLLIVRHGEHLLSGLAFLLPFACIFMHVFMHGRHRHGGHGTRGGGDGTPPARP